MRSIQKIVDEYIETKPFIKDLISRDLIDKTNLAKLIFEDNSEYGVNGKLNTYLVAVSRYQKKLILKHISSTQTYTNQYSLSSRYPVFWTLFQFENHADLVSHFEQFDIDHRSLLIIKNASLTLVTNKNYRFNEDEGLRSKLKKSYSNLCEIAISFGDNDFEESGLLYKVSNALYWKNYSVYNITVSGNKILLYIDNRHSTAILTILQNELDFVYNTSFQREVV